MDMIFTPIALVNKVPSLKDSLQRITHNRAVFMKAPTKAIFDYDRLCIECYWLAGKYVKSDGTAVFCGPGSLNITIEDGSYLRVRIRATHGKKSYHYIVTFPPFLTAGYINFKDGSDCTSHYMSLAHVFTYIQEIHATADDLVDDGSGGLLQFILDVDVLRGFDKLSGTDPTHSWTYGLDPCFSGRMHLPVFHYDLSEEEFYYDCDKLKTCLKIVGAGLPLIVRGSVLKPGDSVSCTDLFFNIPLKCGSYVIGTVIKATVKGVSYAKAVVTHVLTPVYNGSGDLVWLHLDVALVGKYDCVNDKLCSLPEPPDPPVLPPGVDWPKFPPWERDPPSSWTPTEASLIVGPTTEDPPLLFKALIRECFIYKIEKFVWNGDYCSEFGPSVNFSMGYPPHSRAQVPPFKPDSPCNSGRQTWRSYEGDWEQVVTNGEIFYRFRGVKPVESPSFSLGGQTLVKGHADATVKEWEDFHPGSKCPEICGPGCPKKIVQICLKYSGAPPVPMTAPPITAFIVVDCGGYISLSLDPLLGWVIMCDGTMMGPIGWSISTWLYYTPFILQQQCYSGN